MGHFISGTLCGLIILPAAFMARSFSPPSLFFNSLMSIHTHTHTPPTPPTKSARAMLTQALFLVDIQG